MDVKAASSSILQFGHKNVCVHNKRTTYQGFFKIDEYKISHSLYCGGQSEQLTREIFERGDAVVLMPYDPVNDLVVVIEQFRPGALRENETPWLLEFVAGMFGKDENPIDVAIRQAKEEANLDINASETIKIMKYLSSPGGMSEAIHLFVAKVDATDIAGVYGLPEEGEDILVHVLSREDAHTLLSQGKITNAATIIGLQWLQMNYGALQKKWQNK